jgi:AcrR family transcriptional regulator
MVSQAERREATIRDICASARKLFGAHGFAATTIDEIAAQAGVAKGAVYHHFPSKEDVFARVLENVQEELATGQMVAPRKQRAPVDRIAAGVARYLAAVSEPEIKQILLIDGPAVLGWLKWREIDMRYFGALTRTALSLVLPPNAPEREVDALAHLVMGAVMEAALLCATSKDTKKATRELTAALGKLLHGLA